jgi:thiol-disulfide isomerase/thioredoxin
MKTNYLKKRWNKYSSNKRWWSITFDFIFLLLVITMIFPASRKTVSSFIVRQTLLAPRASSATTFLSEKDWNFRLSDANGQVINLAELKGKPLFINYWATWCPPCIAEMPSIQKLYDKYQNDVNFVFINNEAPDVVKAFMNKHNHTLPLYKIAGSVPEQFATSTLPTTILISTKGRVVLFKTGAARWDAEKFYTLLDDLIVQK